MSLSWEPQVCTLPPRKAKYVKQFCEKCKDPEKETFGVREELQLELVEGDPCLPTYLRLTHTASRC
ncbi:hypothetical protein N7524_010939 [Penicillium chrysogenum]|nr:hypothetical protein N7524_010939 [Penicillium chrysogenum]